MEAAKTEPHCRKHESAPGKHESQVDYNPRTQNQVKFLFPQYLGFIDPKGTQMTYKLTMAGRGRPQPSGRAGVHSLWRDFRIQDGTAQTVLEEVQDYNVLTSQWWGYTQNDSIASKRNLFEGRQVSEAIDRNIYYQPANARWEGAGGVTAAQPAQTLQIQQPLYSGILAGDVPCCGLMFACHLHVKAIRGLETHNRRTTALTFGVVRGNGVALGPEGTGPNIPARRPDVVWARGIVACS